MTHSVFHLDQHFYDSERIQGRGVYIFSSALVRTSARGGGTSANPSPFPSNPVWNMKGGMKYEGSEWGWGLVNYNNCLLLCRLSYIVWLLEDFIQRISASIDVHVMYDIACTLVQHLKTTRGDSTLLNRTESSLHYLLFMLMGTRQLAR